MNWNNFRPHNNRGVGTLVYQGIAASLADFAKIKNGTTKVYYINGLNVNAENLEFKPTCNIILTPGNPSGFIITVESLTGEGYLTFGLNNAGTVTFYNDKVVPGDRNFDGRIKFTFQGATGSFLKSFAQEDGARIIHELIKCGIEIPSDKLGGAGPSNIKGRGL